MLIIIAIVSKASSSVFSFKDLRTQCSFKSPDIFIRYKIALHFLEYGYWQKNNF